MSCVSLEHLRMSNVNNNLKSFLRHIHCPKIHHTECINKEKTSSHHGQDQKQEWDPLFVTLASLTVGGHKPSRKSGKYSCNIMMPSNKFGKYSGKIVTPRRGSVRINSNVGNHWLKLAATLNFFQLQCRWLGFQQALGWGFTNLTASKTGANGNLFLCPEYVTQPWIFTTALQTLMNLL